MSKCVPSITLYPKKLAKIEKMPCNKMIYELTIPSKIYTFSKNKHLLKYYLLLTQL